MIKKAYKLYAAKYGNKAQLIKAIEELSELQKAIAKYLNNQGNIEDIIQEVADVELMTEQIKLMFDCHKKVEKIKVFKINRMIKRTTN